MDQSNYVHIDEVRVTALAVALAGVAPGAEALGRKIDGFVSEAADLGAPIFPAVFSSVQFLGGMGPGGKLVNVGKDAPDTAAEIRRRLEFLAACERLRAEGIVIDPSLAFEDGELPSREDIEELAAMFREDGPDVVLATQDVSRYSPAEVDAAIAMLSDEELQAMNEWLSYPPAMRPGGASGFLAGAGRLETSSWLFANVSPTQMERLHKQVPVLEPARPDDDGTGWQTVDLDLANEDFSYEDVDQGGLGDCWFLAGLGATAVSNPDFIRDNIRENPNGSYTVTLYRDGEPVEVTVSNYLPDPPYAGRDDAPNWVAIYEKAAAQLHGGGSYEGMEGGWGWAGLELVTGGNSNLDVFKPSLEELEQRLDAGHPVVVSTGSRLPWFGASDNLVGDHQYIVVDVTTNAEGERVVHLRNPWGETHGEKYVDVYLTEGEYHDYFPRLWDVPAPG